MTGKKAVTRESLVEFLKEDDAGKSILIDINRKLGGGGDRISFGQTIEMPSEWEEMSGRHRIKWLKVAMHAAICQLCSRIIKEHGASTCLKVEIIAPEVDEPYLCTIYATFKVIALP